VPLLERILEHDADRDTEQRERQRSDAEQRADDAEGSDPLSP
jgi:hypothetical protein